MIRRFRSTSGHAPRASASSCQMGRSEPGVSLSCSHLDPGLNVTHTRGQLMRVRIHRVGTTFEVLLLGEALSFASE